MAAKLVPLAFTRSTNDLKFIATEGAKTLALIGKSCPNIDTMEALRKIMNESKILQSAMVASASFKQLVENLDQSFYENEAYVEELVLTLGENIDTNFS